MNYVDYYIPANFTDAGKLMGFFPVRNTIEALILAGPILIGCFFNMPFSISTNLIIAMVFGVPAGGLALIGIQDDCLSQFFAAWWRWRRRKGIITYRGTVR